MTAERIRDLNDHMRKTVRGGRFVATQGVIRRGEEFFIRAWRAVREFDAFEPGDDPYGEHDFGAVEVDGVNVFWKIDYYDQSMQFRSEDPADPKKTNRILTIMLAEEY